MFLQRKLKELHTYAGQNPVLYILEKLKCPDENNRSLEETISAFFGKVRALITEVGEKANIASVRKRIVKAVVSELPDKFNIDTETWHLTRSSTILII